MSVFLSPAMEPASSEQERRYRRLTAYRFWRRLVLLSFVAALALAFLFDRCIHLLYLAGLLVLVYMVLTLASGRLCLKGGRAAFEQVLRNPGSRELLQLISQVPEITFLQRPVFKCDTGPMEVDLAAVSDHGAVFVQASAMTNEEAARLASGLRSMCSELRENLDLPLLDKISLLELRAAHEARLPKDGWLLCTPSDLTRLFLQPETPAGKGEVDRALRALYNMSLPPGYKSVPSQGGLPPNERPTRRAHSSGDLDEHKGLEAFSKICVLLLFVIFLSFLSIYVLQYLDYGRAEKLLIPVRSALRSVLPQDWQQRLRLGEETAVNEQAVLAKMASPVRLSDAVGSPGKGRTVSPGAEVQILQFEVVAASEWYLVKTSDNAVGWLPANVVSPRHLLPKGTPLYKRPDINAISDEHLDHDTPAALISTWIRPSGSGDEVWSKVSFLDKRIRYIRKRI